MIIALTSPIPIYELNRVVVDADNPKTSPPNGSSITSCIKKENILISRKIAKRRAVLLFNIVLTASDKFEVRFISCELGFSCFHSAIVENPIAIAALIMKRVTSFSNEYMFMKDAAAIPVLMIPNIKRVHTRPAAGPRFLD